MSVDTDDLIASLGSDLPPVRRLAAPIWRIAAWCALSLAFALWLGRHADFAPMVRHMRATPDLGIAWAGALLTAIAAAIATFEVSLPDRSPHWAWLPVPSLLLWIGASGAGCLRTAPAGLHTLTFLLASDNCLPFILKLSIPLAIALLLLLRPVATLRPERTTLMGGLAIAAMAASLLGIIHPYDAGVADLAAHAIGILLVIAVLRLLGTRLLETRLLETRLLATRLPGPR